ncbi:fimbrial protein [Chania multitudinisentens RB-25]|uniref:Fimbrial protein n=1 Tax=Chania multitudinisentens RB-25 TaxID=1441930 RepID=W0LFJ0_9GAMM|nr:fimbrial protein [Chania multitudinisentens]AHG21159.1 fimbrial protein [Chania multitudinisentens RB-25]
MWKMGAGILLTLLLGPKAIADWNDRPLGGLMRFQGEVIAETCTVETKDQHLMVSMGHVTTDRFQLAGDEADPVLFDLHLQNCNPTVSRNVGVIFHGMADKNNPEMLSVGDEPGVATGVAVALFDNRGRFIPLNTAPRYWVPLQDGPLTLHFVAKYRATGQPVSDGLVNAQAWFALTYQ